MLSSENSQLSVYDYCFSLHQKFFGDYRVIANYSENDSSGLESYLAALGRFQEKGGYNFQAQIDKYLSIADFVDHSQPFGQLSEGQKRLVYLISMLADQKELLILDEPTNHVDSDLKQRYIKLIKDYPGAVLVVTHDRELIAEACTTVWEIEDRALEVYNGSWDLYKSDHEIRLKSKAEAYRQTATEVERLEELLSVTEGMGRKPVKSRIAQEKAKLAHTQPGSTRKAVKAKMSYEGKYSKFMLRISDLDLTISGNPVLVGFNLEVMHGDKVALIGPNGSGKSSLLKTVLEKPEYIEFSGDITIGNSAKIGYFSQKLEFADEDQSLLEHIRSEFQCDKTKGYGLLLKYLYSKEQADQRISELSGGEKK